MLFDTLCKDGRYRDISYAKIYLAELIIDMHKCLPMNIRPVEAFEISLSEIEA
jgi:hypothetical protein